MFKFKDYLEIEQQLLQLNDLHTDKSSNVISVISVGLLLGLVVFFPLMLPILSKYLISKALFIMLIFLLGVTIFFSMCFRYVVHNLYKRFIEQSHFIKDKYLIYNHLQLLHWLNYVQFCVFIGTMTNLFLLVIVCII